MIHIIRLLVGAGILGAITLILAMFVVYFPLMTFGTLLIITCYIVGDVITEEIIDKK